MILKNIENIKTLNLSGNELSSLPKGTFKKFSNLEELDPSDNDLSALPDDIFDNLTSLERFYRNDNKFNKIGVEKDRKKPKKKVLHST